MSSNARTWMIALGAGLAGVIVGGALCAWYFSGGWSDQPWPDYAGHDGGLRYCAALGDLARSRSFIHTLIASTLALVGSSAFIIGNLLQPGAPEGRWVRNWGALCISFGGLLVFASYYEFSRADAASLTAAATAVAQADAARAAATTPAPPADAPDREAYVTCALARATWLKSRVESSALAQSLTSGYSAKGKPHAPTPEEPPPH
jgi:hypothetical protein